MDGENEMLAGLLKREFEIEENELDHDAWLKHRIKFKRRPQELDLMARNEDINDYAVFDPREQNNSKGGSSRHRDREKSERSSNSLGIDESEWNSGSSNRHNSNKNKERD